LLIVASVRSFGLYKKGFPFGVTPYMCTVVLRASNLMHPCQSYHFITIITIDMSLLLMTCTIIQLVAPSRTRARTFVVGISWWHTIILFFLSVPKNINGKPLAI
jgi:hypothetical protein